MRKPTLMIAVGFPGGPHSEQQDEDLLNREQDGNGDDDIATEAICSIIEKLHRGGPSAVRDLRRHIQALEEVCRAFMDRDQQGLEDAAAEACDALRDMMGD